MGDVSESFPDSKTDAVAARPTWVRWQIVGLLMAYSFMSWFNRVSMPAAYDEQIGNQFPISPEEIGWVYSALLLVYAVFMTPGGWFIDQYGSKIALVVMGFGSALFVALTGAVGMGFLVIGLILPAFLVIRPLVGLFSAPIYPASARIISDWIPFSQRAWANGLVTAAAPVGMASTFVVFGKLMDWVGWSWAFVISGAFTALLAVLWTAYATNRARQHRWVNTAEQLLIASDQSAPTCHEANLPTSALAHEPGNLGKLAGKNTRATPAPDWLMLLRNRSLVCLTLSYGAVGYFEYLFNFWMHYYLENILRLGKDESRYYGGILFLAQGAGMVLGGWASDRLQRIYGYRLGRAIVPVAGMLGSAALLVLGLCATQPAWMIAWFALAIAAVGACEGPFWATAIELGGRRGGTSAGICNTGGNVGGLLAPVITPLVSESFGWIWGIGLGSVVCLLGVCLWFWIDPTERTEP